MIFALLTLLAALSVAAVTEWFSVVGIMAIYAGAPLNAALIMGLVLGGAKLVNISWLYRNWKFASWKLKAPLVYFTIALMIASSIGVYGFLTKAHLEQGASTIDNSAKVERLEQQIVREKSTIADNEKVIAQLDTTINSFLGKDKADRALAVRRAQAPQRKQLRDEIGASQKLVDGFSEEKLTLTSQVRAMQLEVGPIKYIADLFYGSGGDPVAKMESAVIIFTLLIVSTLDPLAVILLIAANHTLLRLQDEKKQKAATEKQEEGTIRTMGVESTNNVKEDTTIQSEPTAEINHKDDIPEIQDNIGTIRIIEDSIPAVDEEILIQDSEQGCINEEEKIDIIEVAETNGDIEDAQPILLESEEPVPPIQEQDVQEHVRVPEETVSEVPEVNEEEIYVVEEIQPTMLPVINTPAISRVVFNLSSDDNTSTKTTDVPKEIPEVVNSNTHTPGTPWAHNASVLAEILGTQAHFIPTKINEETKQKTVEKTATPTSASATSTDADRYNAETSSEEIQTVVSKRSADLRKKSFTFDLVEGALNKTTSTASNDKYPKALSWLKEFKGD